MPADEIYEETIPFLVGKLVMALMIALSLLFLFIFIYQQLSGPVGSRPAPDWLYLVMFVLFAGISYLVTSFRKLTISITSQVIKVTFGIFKYTISWGNVEGCYLDKNPGIAYGGWGVRIGKTKGKSVLVYNVVAAPRVILELKKGRFGQFAFSTKRPDEVMTIVQQQIRK
jgi:hypothetical protein